LAASLAGASREEGSEAASAARQLVDCIDQLDAEIAALGRDASVSEIVRLEERLTGLASGRTAQSPEQDEMRRLVASQLALMRRLRAQHEFAMHRRAHLLDLLESSWRHVTDLQSASGDEVAARAQRARVREICASIRARIDQVPPAVADRQAARSSSTSPQISAPDARAL
jgi:hypothetical protein